MKDAPLPPAGDRRNKLLLFLIGQNLMLLNYVLIRQMTISFSTTETSALIMALAYFSGISLGYLRPDRITPALCRRLLPFFMVVQIALIAGGPLLARALVVRAGTTAAYVVVFVLTTLGSTSLYSVFLPNLIGSDDQSTRRYYSAEVLGSLAGILLLPGLSWAGMVATHAVYLVSFLAIALLLGSRPLALGAMAALAAAFVIASDAIDKRASAALYEEDLGEGAAVRVVYTRYSPYHKVEVAETARGARLLLLDGQIQFDPSWHADYSYFVAEYPARLLGRPTVCVAGCGSMSTVGRIGAVAESIHIVDLDQAVFETSRDFFRDFNRLGELGNWTFESDDAKHFFATTGRAFDLIIDDIPPARTRQVALTYTKEFFALVRSRLTPRGIFSLPTLVSVRSKRSAYGRRILATLADVFDQVVVLTVHGSSYCFATGKGLSLDEALLRGAIDHPDAASVRIMLPDEVKLHVQGTTVISTDNMADLINE